MPDPKYALKVAASVSKKLRSLEPPERRRLTTAILALAKDPFPPGKKWKRLKGLHDQFGRLRVGDYWVLYEVIGEEVHILAVVHRRDLEKWLRQRRKRLAAGSAQHLATAST